MGTGAARKVPATGPRHYQIQHPTFNLRTKKVSRLYRQEKYNATTTAAEKVTPAWTKHNILSRPSKSTSQTTRKRKTRAGGGDIGPQLIDPDCTCPGMVSFIRPSEGSQCVSSSRAYTSINTCYIYCRSKNEATEKEQYHTSVFVANLWALVVCGHCRVTRVLHFCALERVHLQRVLCSLRM